MPDICGGDDRHPATSALHLEDVRQRQDASACAAPGARDGYRRRSAPHLKTHDGDRARLPAPALVRALTSVEFFSEPSR